MSHLSHKPELSMDELEKVLAQCSRRETYFQDHVAIEWFDQEGRLVVSGCQWGESDEGFMSWPEADEYDADHIGIRSGMRHYRSLGHLIQD